MGRSQEAREMAIGQSSTSLCSQHRNEAEHGPNAASQRSVRRSTGGQASRPKEPKVSRRRRLNSRLLRGEQSNCRNRCPVSVSIV